MASPPITHLFTDLGGVLLTNGWDRHLREQTADHFGLDREEMNERHHLTYDTYESGKMPLSTYLERVVFYEPRPFTPQEFVDHVLNAVRPFPEMIDLVRRIKERHGIRIGVVSNEGREIAVDRIARFKLGEFVDFFIVSCFVHFRKPDVDIFRVALDTAQAAPESVVYLEDRRMFHEVAQGLGLRSIWHRDYESTKRTLAEWGLEG
jgi:putative hydrolase of the HAD superfamily